MKVTQGHLTQTEKTHIKAILDQSLMCGKIGRKSYFLSLEENIYTVKIQQIDRGMIPVYGSELRVSTYTHKFII